MANVMTTLPEQDLQAHFSQIGRFGGPLSKPDERAEEYRFWEGLGVAGAVWLIRKAQRVNSPEQTSGIADVLAAIGSDAIEPIADALSKGPAEDMADVLLSALTWMAPGQVGGCADRIAGVLVPFLCHPDDAVRSRSVTATAALPTSVALTMLHDRLEKEADPNVRQVIADEIERRT